ncbi:hypothetical protein G3D75_002840, partial [Escherichia coli]|nr:hypothetical protein [Escherichia coli]
APFVTIVNIIEIACFFVTDIINTVLLLFESIFHCEQKRRKVKISRKCKTTIALVLQEKASCALCCHCGNQCHEY